MAECYWSTKTPAHRLHQRIPALFQVDLAGDDRGHGAEGGGEVAEFVGVKFRRRRGHEKLGEVCEAVGLQRPRGDVTGSLGNSLLNLCTVTM